MLGISFKRNLSLFLTVVVGLLTMLLIPLGRSLERLIDLKALSSFSPSMVLFMGLILAFAYYFPLSRLWGYTVTSVHAVVLVSLLLLFESFRPGLIEYSHLFLYSSFSCCLLFCLYADSYSRRVATIWVLGFALAVFDEFLQWLHPERVFDLRDIGLNVTATTVGLVLGEPYHLFFGKSDAVDIETLSSSNQQQSSSGNPAIH